MSDEKAARALRSDAPLVLVESAAGCGKTYQGACYAKELVQTLSDERLLILTHTNAARDEFAKRTQGAGGRAEIRTIDSMVTRIAAAYCTSLGLPSDVTAWTRQQGRNGFDQLRTKVAGLVTRAPEIARALATRHTTIICDEHQDCTAPQNQLVLCLHEAGARVRIFGDPMQAIYTRSGDQKAWQKRWKALHARADVVEKLRTPHRWIKHGAAQLGKWIQDARRALEAGEPIDLRGGLPDDVLVFRADNRASPTARHLYLLHREERTPIDRYINSSETLLILSPRNATCQALRASFARRIPIWEGHTRYGLSELVLACQRSHGDTVGLAEAFIRFVQGVATGFTASIYGRILKREVSERCSSRRRARPAKIQKIAQFIVESPDHRGVGRAIAQLIAFINCDQAFKDIKVDLWRELRDATRLAEYDDPDECLAELALRRSYTRAVIPPRAISTIHKAKGLEREQVLVMPCDQQNFGESDGRRRLLYVALSRATKRLALVVPRRSVSPLLRI